MGLSLCGTTAANTGEIACDKSRGVAKKLFIFNGTIASGDYAIEATLFGKLVANSKLSKDATNKIFPLPEIQDAVDSSEANREGTLGLGYKTTLIEGKPAYTFKMFAGMDLLKRLRKWNNQTVRFIEWDSNNTVWFSKSGTNAIGFQAKLFVTGGKLATGQNVEEGVVTVTLSVLNTTEYIDNAYYADMADHNVNDIVALLDVNMALVSNASNVHQISLKASGSNLIGSQDLPDEIMTALGLLDANFTAYSGASSTNPSTSLEITSVAANGKNLAVTYDSTAYTSATGYIKLVPPTPAQLDAGDVPDLEILPVIYAKPS